MKDLATRIWQRFRSWPMWVQIVAGIVVLSVIFGPFIDDEEPEQEVSSEEATTTTKVQRTTTTLSTTSTTEATTTATTPPDPGYVTESDYGEDWPLTIDEGTVWCVEGSAVILAADVGVFALNGLARGRAEANGWRELEEIWRDNPEIPGTKISIHPLIELGLDLCED